jgi:16S rRNA processing protein RimM
MGLEVFNREGEHLGKVADLMSTGPQTVLVLEKEGVKVSDQCMIPFVAQYIDHVKIEQGQIWVDWQLDY